MGPIQAAFTSAWPEAETINLLDDGLAIDRARKTELSGRMISRFVAFGQYGAAMEADGILVTCSAFGPAIEQLAASLAIPVLKPNEAMFHAAGTNIGMLATFGFSVPTMTAEFDSYVASVGPAAAGRKARRVSARDVPAPRARRCVLPAASRRTTEAGWRRQGSARSAR